ncbi:MAG: HAD family hydrolase [Tateyamaria sp.]|nr:HAD family hydrolase [Tateyamaria sp.]MDG1420789.1 HAD family hydrolase [Tateyamaria sp.]MDG1678330.1 HAD family hydrolase [Tateyamaria sp.]MDG2377657.1 HAD family hydrolase [Tateyamaria sp.]
MTRRIAMWSGPRNLSTAMMYSFGARNDCYVVDEPFYAAYLAATGLNHPLRNQVINSQDTVPTKVVESLFSPVLKPLFYQKHMAHHISAGWPMYWIKRVINVFLIRHPARVIASYAKKRESLIIEDIGLIQQVRIFEMVESPIVIDSSDIRRDPSGMLQKLCHRIGVEWDEKMLGWPKGGHSADGIWAAHWYGSVHQSQGFEGEEGILPELTEDYEKIKNDAMPYYETLAAHRII